MRKLTLCILAALLAVACTPTRKHYIIGVSQCSEDIWREKQNAELRMGAYFHDDVELRFAAAYDNDERQVQQIDSLVQTGIDLLIVAPNQVATISPAIDRAYDKGIPVIVFERKTNAQKYTAFISADNYEMGRVMGDYVASRLNHRGRVVEIMGLKGSSPAIERHKGFADALSIHPGIKLVTTLQGDWTEESAYEAVGHWLDTAEGSQAASAGIDYVFGQNDRMAMGARKALKASSLADRTALTKYCGIDGLADENGGIRLVRDSILDATYIYPTHGDRLLSLAMDILEGRPYDKDVKLMSALVTQDNANVLLMQNEEITRQSGYLDQLHDMASDYLSQLDTQRTVNWLACGIIVLLLLVIVLSYLYRQGKISLRRQRVVSNLWNLENAEVLTQEDDKPAPEEAAPATAETEAVAADTSAAPAAGSTTSGADAAFVTRFKEFVESRLQDSDLSVEDLAADMNLSRVQLYRKVKSITGSSPVELLRTARLNRGYQLLLTTDKTISEVAYAVGFSAPSYFTKCFKEEFGQSPTDMRL